MSEERRDMEEDAQIRDEKRCMVSEELGDCEEDEGKCVNFSEDRVISTVHH